MRKIVTFEPEVGDKVIVARGDTRGFYGLGTVTSEPYGGTRYGVRIGTREEYILPHNIKLVGVPE